MKDLYTDYKTNKRGFDEVEYFERIQEMERAIGNLDRYLTSCGLKDIQIEGFTFTETWGYVELLKDLYSIGDTKVKDNAVNQNK